VREALCPSSLNMFEYHILSGSTLQYKILTRRRACRALMLAMIVRAQVS